MGLRDKLRSAKAVKQSFDLGKDAMQKIAENIRLTNDMLGVMTDQLEIQSKAIEALKAQTAEVEAKIDKLVKEMEGAEQEE